RHVPDLVAFELHHVDVVRLHALARGWTWATLTRVGAEEDPVRADVLALLVRREGLDLVTAVWDERQETLHPVRVLLKGLHAFERVCLGRKRGMGLTELATAIPPLAGLTRGEELPGDCGDRRHGRPSLVPE